MKFLVAVLIAFMAQAQQDDASFTSLIGKDNKAERPRYDYAFFLYTKKRFPDAREQLKFLFALNPQHNGGRKLMKNISEVEGLADISYQEQQMRMFILAKMQSDKGELAPVPITNEAEFTPERVAAIRKDLENRYNLIDRLKTEVRVGPAETLLQAQMWLAREKGENDKAERVARDWLAKYEKSPIAKADFATFLILRDRIPQAEVLIQSALEESPHCLKLQILSDALKDMKKATSSEKTAAVKNRIHEELHVYKLATTGQLQETPRAAASEVAK